LDNSTNNATDKLTDKAFSRLMLTGILGIVVCIVCLCSATWAWFNTNVSAIDNRLGSGKFSLDVSVTDKATSASVLTYDGANGSKLCVLSSAGLYEVTLTMTEDTTVSKGFCVIAAKGARYSTSTIFNQDTKSITFMIDAKEANLALTFEPAWGSPADIAIRSGETFPLGTPAVTE